MCGKMYILFRNGKATGYICMKIESKAGDTVILHAFTLPEYRQKGVFHQLLKHIMALQPKGTWMKLYIPEQSVLHAPLLNLGFQIKDGNRTLHLDLGNCKENIERYFHNEGKAIIAHFVRKGYRCVAFEQASNDVIQQLIESQSSPFRNSLNVSPGIIERMDKSLSFALLHDNVLMAYTIVSRQDHRSVTFEHLSAAQKVRGTGCFLLPLERSIRTGLEQGYTQWGGATWLSISKTVPQLYHHLAKYAGITFDYTLFNRMVYNF